MTNFITQETSVFIRQTGVECNFQKKDSWIVMAPIGQQIKHKIETRGLPLKEWPIQINYGIKTGFNEAFIIDATLRDKLIDSDPKSAEIIRPILRGRDIRRYGYEFANLYLINVHNGIKEKGLPPVNIEDYPAIKDHLDQYYPQLVKRADKGQTPYNLRNCAYMDDFDKQKIIYPEITKYLNFYLDNRNFYTNNKCFIMSGVNLNFLTAFFNSSLFKFCFRDNFPELLGGTRELRKVFLEEIQIMPVSKDIDDSFKQVLNEIGKAQESNLPIRDLELKIDSMIFDLYSLSPVERQAIGFIEIK